MNDKSITCVTSQGNMVFLPLPLHNPIFIVAGFIIPFTTGSCVTGKCLVSFNFTIRRNVVDGHALLGHVFANVSATGVMDCHRACQSNCRCLSFNFLTHSSQDNCQLNEENRHLKPGALIPMEGFQYYDLGIIYNSEVKCPPRNYSNHNVIKHKNHNSACITAKFTKETFILRSRLILLFQMMF